ncbi:hypothetical protein BGW80DRAFT_1462947 [Lactifluus volemus]|nr:hypothetical protein BGW80DRAFT_1462947 [Lactifluus volemus]
MPCASSTSSFRLRIRDPPAVQATGETGYPPASSMDSTTTNSAGTYATPDADCDPEANMDTSLPTTMIPRRTSSTDLASHHHKRTSKSDSRNSQLQLRDARRHARLNPPTGFTSFQPPASSFSDDTHAEPFESALSSPLSRSRSPSSSSPLFTFIKDPARLGGVWSRH